VYGFIEIDTHSAQTNISANITLRAIQINLIGFLENENHVVTFQIVHILNYFWDWAS